MTEGWSRSDVFFVAVVVVVFVFGVVVPAVRRQRDDEILAFTLNYDFAEPASAEAVPA